MIRTPFPVLIFASILSLFARGLARAASAAPNATLTPAANSSGPQIHFAEPVFDFGRIAAGTAAKHNFEFTNTGGAPLIITGVQPFCDCTTAGKWSVTVAPGQTGVIPIEFDSSGYSGAVEKRVLVASNDPHQREVMLQLKAVVTAPIEVSPSNVFFTPKSDATETKIIRITNHTREPLLLEKPKSPNPAFAVVLKSIRPQQEYELSVSTVSPLRAGMTRDLITIKTNSAQVPVIAITAVALVKRPPDGGKPEIRNQESEVRNRKSDLTAASDTDGLR